MQGYRAKLARILSLTARKTASAIQLQFGFINHLQSVINHRVHLYGVAVQAAYVLEVLRLNPAVVQLFFSLNLTFLGMHLFFYYLVTF